MQGLAGRSGAAVRPTGEIHAADTLLALSAGPQLKSFLCGHQMKALRSSILRFDHVEAKFLSPITRALLGGLGVVWAHQESNFFPEPSGLGT